MQSVSDKFRGIASHKEMDQDWFFGRDGDIAEVLLKLEDHRIVVISGASGSGKTSLLLAGVVPTLREMRLSDDRDIRAYAAGFPIVFRDWGGLKASDPTQTDLARFVAFIEVLLTNYADKEDDGLRALLGMCGEPGDEGARIKRLPRDKFATDINRFEKAVANALDGATGSGATRLEHLVENIARECGGLTLVFDQLEELLRINRKFIDTVNETIYRLRQIRGVRIVLSLREEYLSELRQFELRGGGLDQTHYYVPKLSRQAAKEVFRDLCAKINEEAGEKRVVLAEDLIDDLESHFSELENIWRPEAGVATDDQSTVELMYLSGVVHQLVHKLEQKKGAGVLKLNRKSMEMFGAQPVLGALRSIFDDCFQHDDDDGADLTEFGPFAAAQIASNLSSGGYKLSQMESHLFKEALGERVKYLKDFEVASALKRLGAEDDPDLKADGRRQKLYDTIEERFSQCMSVLEKAEIVKRFVASSEDSLWELTHDRLGMPFLLWADEKRHTFQDCVADPLGSRGVSPMRVPRDGVEGRSANNKRAIEHLTWLGCYLEPERDNQGAEATEPARLKNIIFESCDFSGSAFDMIYFENCEFRNCRFDGALFKRCTFKDCQFENIGVDEAVAGGGFTIGFLGCRFEGKKNVFDKCVLVQPAFTLAKTGAGKAQETGIEHDVKFKDVRVRLGSFNDADNDTTGRFVFDKASAVRWCAWDQSFAGRVVIPENRIMNSDLDENPLGD